MTINTTQQEEDAKNLPAALPTQTRCIRSSIKWTQGTSGCSESIRLLHPLLASSPRALVHGADCASQNPALWVYFSYTKAALSVSEKNTIYLSPAQAVAKGRKCGQTPSLSLNGTFQAWASHPCQLDFLLKHRFRETLLHLNIWGFYLFSVFRIHIWRNSKKLQQLLCKKSFPLRRPHVLAKQLITNCRTEMLSVRGAGGNLVLSSLP